MSYTMKLGRSTTLELTRKPSLMTRARVRLAYWRLRRHVSERNAAYLIAFVVMEQMEGND